MRVVADVEFFDGTKKTATFTFGDWQQLWRTGELDGKPVKAVEVESSTPGKMANRVAFEQPG